MHETNDSNKNSGSSHRLAWLDYLGYELFRATGRNQLMQCLWIYDREVDLATLQRTNERLAALSFNRLIEPSFLPWSRPKWVKPISMSAPIDQTNGMLPRSLFMHWANGHARMPIDPVTGPAWRIGIQLFDDGSTAISFVGSHLVIDGMGALRVIDAAIRGIELPNTYKTRGEEGWLTRCISDVRQTIKDAPCTIFSLTKIAKDSWSKTVKPELQQIEKKIVSLPRKSVIELSSVTATIESTIWDTCASRLGGHTYSLLPGFVAALASNIGRCRSSDGAVSLLIPIDRRQGLFDGRALAFEFGSLTVMPNHFNTDLRQINASLKAMLRGAQKNQISTLTTLLPAIAWMPRKVITKFVNRMFAYADERPVSCSNLGDLPDKLGYIDGAPCSQIIARAVDVNVSRADLERSHGHLVVVSSRYKDTISLSVEACQMKPSLMTTNELRLIIEKTLTQFGMGAKIYC
jgi:hypothetical protein